MNTYHKYIPNVFLAKCTEPKHKGETAILTTKYGKENEVIIYNLIMQKGDFYYYSFIRADGYNIQERAKAKSEKYLNWSESAEKKSLDYFEASQEGREFLSLGEPIKVGHHSEKRHRGLIERNHNRIRKSIKFSDKASEHTQKAEYWERRANDINLSMPESLEYYKYKLEEAQEIHRKLKSGEIERSHSFSLTYAKKDVNKFENLYKNALQLWGEIEK